EDGIRDFHVTGVQTCALPIWPGPTARGRRRGRTQRRRPRRCLRPLRDRTRTHRRQPTRPARPRHRQARAGALGLPQQRHDFGQGPRGQRQEHHGRDAAGRRPGHAGPAAGAGRGRGRGRGRRLRAVRPLLRRGRLMRRELAGQGASRGSALGRARVRLPHVLEVVEERVEDVDAELARLHDAIRIVRAEMHGLRARLHGALAQEVGEFLDLHALLLDDPELLHGLDDLIRDGRYTADYALRVQRNRLAGVFAGMDDDYLRSRIDDVDQVIGRIHAALHRDIGDGPAVPGIAGEILVTDNVAPAELAQLQGQGVMAVVTTSGNPLSHTAILARSLHLPLVVGAAGALQKINDGDVLAVDGGSGRVVVEPAPADLREHRARLREQARERKQLRRLRREPSRTLDGVDIKLWANAESRADVAEAHALGAAGVGLYRTEFLFLGSRELPDEEAQFRAYRDLVLGMTGRTVTIRTLDVGADKADKTGLALENEPNPAMGLRGVRLSLARHALFDSQLRAIARASGYGPVRLLVPMVAAREEVL